MYPINFYTKQFLKALCFNVRCYSSFHAGSRNKAILKRSMKYIQQQTCVEFIEVEPNDKFYSHYVHFISTKTEEG